MTQPSEDPRYKKMLTVDFYLDSFGQIRVETDSALPVPAEMLADLLEDFATGLRTGEAKRID
jgi:hypothetical protein